MGIGHFSNKVTKIFEIECGQMTGLVADAHRAESPFEVFSLLEP